MKKPFTLRVMTYNIYAGRNYNDKNIVNIANTGKAMRPYHADLIGLNEVLNAGKLKDIFTDQTKTLGTMLGYQGYFAKATEFDWGGPFGNALLSRFPISFAQTIPIEDPPVQDEDTLYQSRCILKAVLDVPGGLTVYVSHFGLANSEKDYAIKKIMELLRMETNPCIFMGDLNMTPEDVRLVPLQSLMRDTAIAAKSPILTFPSDNPNRRIDYIFVSEGIETVLADAPCETVSDHKPYWADIVLPG